MEGVCGLQGQGWDRAEGDARLGVAAKEFCTFSLAQAHNLVMSAVARAQGGGLPDVG